MELRPISGVLGAELLGLDLSKPLRDSELEQVKKALADHLVVAFRGQRLEIDQFERFALQLGEFGETPFLTPLGDHPNVVPVTREPDEKGALFGASWHSDWSFQERPPSYTLLYGKVVPEVGGDTAFTNQYLAYETLSAGLRQLLEGVKAIHSARRSYAPTGTFGQPDKRRSMKIEGSDEAWETRLHPLIRRHPVTGRKALFANEVYTIGLEDMAPAESDAILKFLFEHSRQVSITCRVRWAPGTLTMWDNRCTQHHAIDDYQGQRREMYRITLAGEEPV